MLSGPVSLPEGSVPTGSPGEDTPESACPSRDARDREAVQSRPSVLMTSRGVGMGSRRRGEAERGGWRRGSKGGKSEREGIRGG